MKEWNDISPDWVVVKNEEEWLISILTPAVLWSLYD